VDIFESNKLSLLLVFFVPGFISMKIWSLIVPFDLRKMSDHLLEAISYSCMNFALLSWLINIVIQPEFRARFPVLSSLAIFSFLFVFPVLWPILARAILKLDFIKRELIGPIPTSWDHYFRHTKSFYALVHLRNGDLLGGFFGLKSRASAFPNTQDIYLEEVWKVNQAGEFQEKVEHSKGMWITRDVFDHIEFFEVIFEEENDA